MRKKTFNSKQGFTLLELLIYVAVLSIITLAIADIFIVFNRGRGQTEARTEVNSDLRFVFNKIKADLSAASDLITPSLGGTSSTTLEMTVGSSTVKYYISGESLVRRVNNDPAVSVISDNISAGSFEVLRIENTNPVFDKKRITAHMILTLDYDSDSPDWQFSQTQQTAASLPLEL